MTSRVARRGAVSPASSCLTVTTPTRASCQSLQALQQHRKDHEGSPDHKGPRPSDNESSSGPCSDIHWALLDVTQLFAGARRLIREWQTPGARVRGAHNGKWLLGFSIG